jgi:hypothetical protein
MVTAGPTSRARKRSFEAATRPFGERGPASDLLAEMATR